METQDLRKRGRESEKYFQRKVRTKKETKFEIENFDWLSDKYMLLHGLRNWTWRVIIEGIIRENIFQLSSSSTGSQKPVAYQHIRVLWFTFLEVAGIKDLDKVPNITDPDGPDIKAAMYMYSMESFLYKRIN